MTHEELSKAIEKGESVWSIESNYNTLKKFVKEHKFDKKMLDILEPSAFYKTKAEAEHYLHHANISRTETLPFFTWEEFLKRKRFHFIDRFGNWYDLLISEDRLLLRQEDSFNVYRSDLTEEDFYKAYDECVRLFRGDE